MSGTIHRGRFRAGLARPRTATLALGLCSVLAAGCVDWGYKRIQLGQEQADYQGVLPLDGTRRTDLGLCYFGVDPFGVSDAIVVLLTPDRRVAGKIRATHVERRFGFTTETGFWLRGELDPELCELSATGPIDTLRAITDDLIHYRGEKLAMDAHAWIGAGLVRLMQRWPHVGDVGLRTESLTEMMERVPGGGVARISVDERGAYLFEYRQGAAP